MLRTIAICLGAVVLVILLVSGVRLGLLLHSLGSYKTYWEDQNKQTATKGAFVYLALGDSTAQGIGASSARRSYVGLIAKDIADKTGRPVQVYNLSVSGAKINNAIKDQLPRIKDFPKPDLVTIEIGANDVPIFEAAKFRQDFSQLLKGLPETTYVANMPSFQHGRKGKLDKNAVEASKIIAELLKDYPKIHLVDVYAATVNQNLGDFGADLFHPSNSGYKNWARAFLAEINTKPDL